MNSKVKNLMYVQYLSFVTLDFFPALTWIQGALLVQGEFNTSELYM